MALNSEGESVVFSPNKPQLMEMLIDAPIGTHLWGRGTGKTVGPLGRAMIRYAQEFPRGLFALEGATYKQHLTRTLPALKIALEMRGYYRDLHYWIGRFPPKQWNVPLPHFCPEDPKHFIFWYTGAAFALVSQDRAADVNGLSIDGILTDEAKTLRADRHNSDLLPANRGNKNFPSGIPGYKFGDLPHHHGVTMVSDMPITSKGDWLLEKRELMNTPENLDRIQMILHLQRRLQMLNSKYNSKKITKEVFNASFLSINKSLLRLRGRNKKGKIDRLHYYSEFSSIENVGNLGWDFIDDQKKLLSAREFDASILGKRPMVVESCFYNELTEQFGYNKFNNDYLEGLDYDFDKISQIGSIANGDVIQGDPIYIAADYGGYFNCIIAGQIEEKTIRFLSNHYVQEEGSQDNNYKIRDAVKAFKRYYTHHANKHCVFGWDQTATGENAIDNTQYYEIVIEELRKESDGGAWSVSEVDLGAAPNHDVRHNLWSNLLRGEIDGVSFEFNNENCKEWFNSCRSCGTREGSQEVKKDKRPERKTDASGRRVNQLTAPHLSDAGDTLLELMLRAIANTWSSLSPILV